MIRKRKGTLILTSVVILLPVLAGLLLWNQLPEQMTTHWGLDGTANGWSGKAFAVFGLPLMLLAVHWLCVFATVKDPGNRNQNRKVAGMVLWIVPILSVFTGGLLYAAALGRDLSVGTWSMLLMSVLFLVIGNYLPKSRQNRTVGIRIKWTLESEENWSVTHRIAGKVWVAGGFVFLAAAFLPVQVQPWVMIAVLPVLVVLPVAYSFRFYRKQVREGTAPTAMKDRSPAEKRVLVISLLVMALILAGCAMLCFTGNIAVVYGEDSFTVEASYYQDLTVEYAAVDRVEFREQDDPGSRRFGFGTPRLLMGSFKNGEFGDYTRYSYTKCGSAVVLRSGEHVLAVSGRDRDSTWAIYRELAERCG